MWCLEGVDEEDGEDGCGDLSTISSSFGLQGLLLLQKHGTVGATSTSAGAIVELPLHGQRAHHSSQGVLRKVVRAARSRAPSRTSAAALSKNCQICRGEMCAGPTQKAAAPLATPSLWLDPENRSNEEEKVNVEPASRLMGPTQVQC